MDKCNCYHQHGLKDVCYGTKEMEECSCGGDESKCNFYPEKRKPKMATEKRLKDANALKVIFDERYDDAFMQSHTRPNIAWWEGYSAGVNWGRNTIADAPTVDAVEVVHGRWEMLGDDYANCTNCGNIFETRPTPMFFKANNKYCRNCGAKMDGDGNGL